MEFSEPLIFTETISNTYTAHSYNYHIDHIKLNEYAVNLINTHSLTKIETQQLRMCLSMGLERSRLAHVKDVNYDTSTGKIISNIDRTINLICFCISYFLFKKISNNLQKLLTLYRKN